MGKPKRPGSMVRKQVLANKSFKSGKTALLEAVQGDVDAANSIAGQAEFLKMAARSIQGDGRRGRRQLDVTSTAVDIPGGFRIKLIVERTYTSKQNPSTPVTQSRASLNHGVGLHVCTHFDSHQTVVSVLHASWACAGSTRAVPLCSPVTLNRIHTPAPSCAWPSLGTTAPYASHIATRVPPPSTQH